MADNKPRKNWFDEGMKNYQEAISPTVNFLGETFVDPVTRQVQYLASRGVEPFVNPKLENNQHSTKNPIKDPYYNYQTGQKNTTQMAWDVGGTLVGFGAGRALNAAAKGASKYVASGAAARALETDAVRTAQAAAAKGSAALSKAKQKVAGVGLTAALLAQSAAPSAGRAGTVAMETIEGAAKAAARGADTALDVIGRNLDNVVETAATKATSAAKSTTDAIKHTSENAYDTLSKYLHPSQDVAQTQTRQQQANYTTSKTVSGTSSPTVPKVTPTQSRFTPPVIPDAGSVGMQFAQIPKVY